MAVLRPDGALVLVVLNRSAGGSPGTGTLGPGCDDLLNPSCPPGSAGTCRSGSRTPLLVSSILWLRPTPSRPTCGAGSDGQGRARDGTAWPGGSPGLSSSPPLSSILQWWKRAVTHRWGCRTDRGSCPRTAPSAGVPPWLLLPAPPSPPQSFPVLPGIPQPPESSWTTLPHVAPLKPSRVSRAPSKAVTRSLRYVPSPSVFPLRSRKLLGFPRRGGEGQGVPRRAPSPWPACGCLVYRCSWRLSRSPALDSFHMRCWFSSAY